MWRVGNRTQQTFQFLIDRRQACADRPCDLLARNTISRDARTEVSKDVQSRCIEPRHQLGIVQPTQLIAVMRKRHAQKIDIGIRVRHRSAKIVLDRVVLIGGFDVRDDAALKTCWQPRTVCSVRALPSNTSPPGRRSSPSAVQST